MVVEIHVTYLGVSGGDGNHEFLTDKEHGHLYASLLTRMVFPVVKVCMLADSNYVVPANFKNIICQRAIVCVCVCACMRMCGCQMSVGGLI